MWSLLCCREKQEPKPETGNRVSKKVRFDVKNSEKASEISQQSPLIQKKSLKKIQSKIQKQEIKTVVEEKIIEVKDTYEGEDLHGKPHGTGVKNYANGDHYRGEWVNGLKEGRGIHQYFELRSRYEGQWKKNLKNGHGKYTEQNGSYFEGEFKDGVKHGKGTYFDNVRKCFSVETYDNGQLQERKDVKKENEHISEEFPTLVLDKQRFNTQDLDAFEKANPQIKQLQLDFLLKYYGLCKVISLEFIDTPMADWKIKDVLAFLTEINLQDYKEIFYQNKIKGKDLLSLEEEQMKNDLKMKLGDRKKLKNYIGYISSLDKKGKEKKAPIIKHRRGSFSHINRKNKYRSIMVRSIDEEIIEEDAEYHQQDSPSSSRLNENKKNFDTDWDQFNSNVMEAYHSMRGSSMKRQSSQKQSQTSVKGSEDNINDQNQLPALNARRKRSEDRESGYLNSLGHQNMNGNKKDKSNSSSSSISSINQLDEEQVSMIKRKKTAHNGQSQEIRELYEFLKEHQSLDFIIKPKDIEITEQIGEGGYGKVYRGKYMSTPVAVKDYIKAGKHHKSRDDFMKQVQIFSDLKHPNIVLYMGMCITVTQYQLVTEYMENGSLFDQIHKKKTQFLPEEQLEIIDDIVRGMVYLHNMKDMLHRDLKSSNVLIAEDWKVKLCDFGLSGHKKKSKKKKRNKIGTYQWMAPEVIRNEEMDFFSDVYSFGVIIWEILTEEIPYQGLSETQITGLIGYDEKHRLHDPPEGSSHFIVNIMKKCLNRDPSKRPTFIQIQKEIDDYRRNNPITKVLWEDK